MRKTAITILSAIAMCGSLLADVVEPDRDYVYEPTPQVLQSRRDFSNDRFGIFIHWGIYSMFGQGEWYLNYGPLAREYAKAARGFYPADFDAAEWIDAIKDSGARYVTFTSRHHDGFSMFHTGQSDYNIVDATPFKRDVLKELADECHKKDIKLHLYYSHLDLDAPGLSAGAHRSYHGPGLHGERLERLLQVHEPSVDGTAHQLWPDPCHMVRRVVGPRRGQDSVRLGTPRPVRYDPQAAARLHGGQQPSSDAISRRRMPNHSRAPCPRDGPVRGGPARRRGGRAVAHDILCFTKQRYVGGFVPKIRVGDEP